MVPMLALRHFSILTKWINPWACLVSHQPWMLDHSPRSVSLCFATLPRRSVRSNAAWPTCVGSSGWPEGWLARDLRRSGGDCWQPPDHAPLYTDCYRCWSGSCWLGGSTPSIASTPTLRGRDARARRSGRCTGETDCVVIRIQWLKFEEFATMSKYKDA